jgi:hypothetical protein
VGHVARRRRSRFGPSLDRLSNLQLLIQRFSVDLDAANLGRVGQITIAGRSDRRGIAGDQPKGRSLAGTSNSTRCVPSLRGRVVTYLPSGNCTDGINVDFPFVSGGQLRLIVGHSEGFENRVAVE